MVTFHVLESEHTTVISGVVMTVLQNGVFSGTIGRKCSRELI